MKFLFGQETIMRNHEASLVRDTSMRVFINTYQKLDQSLANTLKAFIDEFKVDEKNAKEDVAEYWEK